MRFTHIADSHLGSWRKEELRALNLKSFEEAINISLKIKADFILIAGDLFDSPYPDLDILKETFAIFRKVYESKIPVFLIAGSHDYSVSGKTFLDVLEKAGFCTNVSLFEERKNKIFLHPTIYKNVAIYGYPGKKSGLEVDEVERIVIQDSPGLFKILMLHTTIKDAVQNPIIKSVNEENLPKVDYVALGHLHINYRKGHIIYAGPTFPNNLSELEELQEGSFYIFDNGKIERKSIKFKEVVSINLEINNSIKANEAIASLLENKEIKDKILILKLSGYLQHGKNSDIDFNKIESIALSKGAFVFLKSTTKLHSVESQVEFSNIDAENIESRIIERFEEANPSKFNYLIPEITRALQIEKLEDEETMTFNERILSESKKIMSI